MSRISILKFILLCLLILVGLKIVGSLFFKVETIPDVKRVISSKPKEERALTSNQLNLNLIKKNLRLQMNPIIELDFKTKAEILELRKQYVRKHPELLKGNYIPSESVFGQIIDGKPWWGMLGIYFYGNGKQSIEGLLEESRFIANPFLLIGISEANAWRDHSPPEDPKPYSPELLELTWSFEGIATLNIEYDVKNYFETIGRLGRYDTEGRKLVIVNYNARDFGYEYMYIDPERSKNIVSHIAPGQPLRIVQFIHLGQSCGYPGGCNNQSPDQPETGFELTNSPASLDIKLWKSAPENVDKIEDVHVSIGFSFPSYSMNEETMDEEANGNTLVTQDTVYRNTQLGFEMTFPAGWYIPSTNERDPHAWDCPTYHCPTAIEIMNVTEGVKDFNTYLEQRQSNGGKPEVLDHVVSGARVIREFNPAAGETESWNYGYLIFFEAQKKVFFVGFHTTDVEKLFFPSFKLLEAAHP